MKTLKRLLSSISKRKNILFNNGFSVEKCYDCNWLIDWSNTVDKKMVYKLFEDEQINYFMSKIKIHKPEYFFDIGAHGGLYSIIFKKKFPYLNILAFEPDIQNRYQLYSNLFLNNFEKKVRVFDFGLSDANAKVPFGIINKNNRGGKRIKKNSDFHISVKTLDEIFNEKGRSCFVKIDVEGHEKEVIYGSKMFLKKNNCLIQVEVTDLDKLKKFESLMNGLGYSLINRIKDFYFSNYIKY